MFYHRFTKVDFVPSFQEHILLLFQVRDVFSQVGETDGLDVRGTLQLQVFVQAYLLSIVLRPSDLFLPSTNVAPSGAQRG